MNVLIPGGASYIGAKLVPGLLSDGHHVTVYDTLYFGGDWLPQHERLRVVKADVRDAVAWRAVCEGQDAVIYLASISRELMCEKNPSLAHAINVECFRPDVIMAKNAGVKQFIYASSVAVYGSSDKPSEEDDALKPTTIYGKGKAECEKILLDHADKNFTCTITRSASVCGYSPRMRLDLTINRMVHDAVRKRVITVEGGEQKRSHVHINDLCEFYRVLLETEPALIQGQAFNIVMRNQTIMQSAAMVSHIVDADIDVKSRVDDRSYSVNGSKVGRVLGWNPTRQLDQAVRDIADKFEEGCWPDSETNPVYQNMADVA